MGENVNNTHTDIGQEIEKRKGNVDRSNHLYSEEEFKGLSREEQLSLARTHWMDSKRFDESKMFQFSYSHFSKICKDLGFEKGVVDTRKEELQADKKVIPIYIDHGRREATDVKKITLSKSTIEKMDYLLEGMSNIEKSKVLDIILEKVLDEKIQDKEVGRFQVYYRPIEEQRIV